MNHRSEGVPRRRLLAGVVGAVAAVLLLGGWAGLELRADRTEAVPSRADDGATPLGGARVDAPGEGLRRLARPVRLDIPVIDVSTRLVRLGLLPDRTVEVPADADLAGWFRRGPVPGGPGSSVVLGHVDSEDGPAVFARLQELRRGDLVSVRRSDGSLARFVVDKSVLYPNADFPALRVYAARGGRRLNLVTCGGSYDSDRGGYQANLVVYTRLATSADRGA